MSRRHDISWKTISQQNKKPFKSKSLKPVVFGIILDITQLSSNFSPVVMYEI